MLKKVLIVLIGFVAILNAEFKHISYEQIKQLGNVPIIDIRTPSEWEETGVIPGSIKLMSFDDRGRIDIKSWLKEFSKYVDSFDKPFVLVCRSGNRTNMLGQYLDKIGYKKVYDLKGGIISGYISKGYKTTKKDYKTRSIFDIFGIH